MVYLQRNYITKSRSHKTPNINRRYRYRILNNFHRIYKKKKQHQNSQRANSIFTNDVFLIIYSYLSKLQLKEQQGDSPTQTSRHTAVREEMSIFSKFLNTIPKNFTSNV